MSNKRKPNQSRPVPVKEEEIIEIETSESKVKEHLHNAGKAIIDTDLRDIGQATKRGFSKLTSRLPKVTIERTAPATKKKADKPTVAKTKTTSETED